MDAGDAFQCWDQAVGFGQVALDDLCFGRESRLRRVPGEGTYRVATGEEFGDDLTAHGSGGTGDKYLLRLCHDTTVGNLAVDFCPQGPSSPAAAAVRSRDDETYATCSKYSSLMQHC